MTPRSPLRLLWSLVVLSLLAAGCDGSGPPTGRRRERSDLPRGGMLRIVSDGGLDSLDPGLMYDTSSFLLARGLYRTLTTHVVTGDGRTELVGDLATDTGTPSADATRWAFDLRPGIRYGRAPGGREVPGVTGEEVVAGDLESAFERMFSPGVAAPYPFYFEAIEGADEFAAGRSSDIAGIETPDDDTIVFHLTRPVGDWAHRLTLPATTPLPDGTDGAAVPTGPYYVARFRPGEVLRLRRSDHWVSRTDPARAAPVDAVRWDLEIDTERALTGLIEGRYHLGAGLEAGGDPLLRAATSRRLAGRVLQRSSGCTRFLWLNTRVEPFDDPLVRRAVNLAIDRYGLRRIYGGPLVGGIATSVLPPGIPGHLPSGAYDPFRSPGHGGDLGRARALMAAAGFPSGYRRAVVVMGSSVDLYARISAAVARDLSKLGFSDVRVRLPDPPGELEASREPGTGVGVGTAAGWCRDFADASSFLWPHFHGDALAGGVEWNFPRLDDDRIDRLIDEAIARPPGAARTEAWERANRAATATGAWVPWLWDQTTLIVSRGLVGAAYDPVLGNVDWVNVGVALEETARRAD